MILSIYHRHYKNNEIAERIIGLHIDEDSHQYIEQTTDDKRYHVPYPTDWDARSVDRMYPYILWEPNLIIDDGEDK